MVEFYLLTFPRFPLRKKEHKSYFGKNRTHDFRTSRCAGYLLDHSISKTPFTHTHTVIYATRAAGLKTHLRERDLCHPCLGSDLSQQRHAEEQSHTSERQDLKLTSAKIHTQKEAPGFIAPALCLNPQQLFAVPTARDPTRYRVGWMLGRALKLTREHLAVAKVDSILLLLTSEEIELL